MEIEQLVPYHALLEASGIIGKHILGNILQKLVEDMVENHEVYKLRGVFPIDSGNHGSHFLRNIGELFFILPHSIKGAQKLCAGRILQSCHYVCKIFAFLTAQVHRGKGVHRHVGIGIISIFYYEEVIHPFTGGVGAEFCFPLYPGSTLLGNRFLL